MKLLTALLLVLSLSSTVATADNDINHHADDRHLLSSIIDYADKIQNAVPTVPTSPMPTETPTFSAAPSPRPSETPTNSPTVSMAPSTTPTIAPTVSAAPTNFPTVSSAPSLKPSIQPSLAPSTSPTKNPTNSPTVSAAPTKAPSSAPSAKPSLNPSAQPSNVPSTVPSDSPSNVPTISAAPSLLYKTTLHATILVPLNGIDSHMNATHVKVFESAARYFIQQNMHSVEGTQGAVLISTVTVTSQRVLDVEDKDLIVEIRVSAVYESLVHPDDFDFKAIVDHGFEENFAVFKSDLLDSEDPFFRPLDPSHEEEAYSTSRSVYIAVIVCSIVASVCATIAACYAIRRSRAEIKKGDKLTSEMNMYPDPVDSNLTQEDVGVNLSHTKSIEIIQVSDSPDKETNDHDNDEKPQETSPEMSTLHKTPQKNKPESIKPETSMLAVQTINGHGSRDGQSYTEILHALPSSTGSRPTKPMSPNTMESGTRLGALAESILRSESFGSNRDPPTEANHYMYSQKPNSKADPAAKYRTATFGVPRPEQRDDFAMRNGSSNSVMSRDPSVIGTQFVGVDALNSFFPPGGRRDPEQRGTSGDSFEKSANRDKPSAERTSRPSPGFHSQPQPSRSTSTSTNARPDRALDWPSEPGQDHMQMTSGRDGRLRVSAKGQWNEPPSPASSAVSSSINAFLNMVGGTLGAAPLASSPVVKAQEKKEEKNEKFHDILQREGLYDVFAPSGALGIVVDTTKDGPAVHSLKQTSPMLGLINPGDLIVGLDAQDTRSMTAATLTRLMASKSNQKERKITLLAADNY